MPDIISHSSKAITHISTQVTIHCHCSTWCQKFLLQLIQCQIQNHHRPPNLLQCRLC